jgi:hypothetical protein
MRAETFPAYPRLPPLIMAFPISILEGLPAHILATSPIYSETPVGRLYHRASDEKTRLA